MSLIDKKLVTPREMASYKLDCKTIELVRFYSEFIGSPQEHVVNEALLLIFRKDKDFNTWLKTNGKSNLASAEASAEGTTQKAGRRATAGGNKA